MWWDIPYDISHVPIETTDDDANDRYSYDTMDGWIGGWSVGFGWCSVVDGWMDCVERDEDGTMERNDDWTEGVALS